MGVGVPQKFQGVRSPMRIFLCTM